ncbi:multidrug resistance-associated ABC transporter [Crassisporium funariophilum]|nr:multidrug resistance-associated ABC transporter [Crassisporium funariophilum]
MAFTEQESQHWFTELRQIKMFSFYTDLENAWLDTLVVPFFAGICSAVLLFTHVVVHSWYRSRRTALATALKSEIVSEEPRLPGRFAYEIEQHTKDHGGLVIYCFTVARLVGCLALFSLSLASLILKHGGSRRGDIKWDGVFSVESLPELSMVATFWYTSFLAAIPLLRSGWARLITRHNNFVLLVACSVYLYRDVWPLATYTQTPVDISEGHLLWAKVAVVTFSAVIIPLFIPRQYVPIDPKNPMEVPNPEQTASIASLMVYTFLDPVVYEAARVAHLSHTQLPPLCDYDHSKYLTEKAFPHLDPFQGAKKRHLFFSLLSVFRWEYTVMAIAITSTSLANFASPVAVYKILAYLESGEGRADDIKPWVWVVCLFLGPVMIAITFQWYIFIGTAVLARTEGLLTQLVFDHSLRIRFKAVGTGDESRSTATSNAVTPVDTPETGSINDSGTLQDNDSQSESTSVAKGKGKPDPPPVVPPANQEKKKNNLIGKINTMVTVDVDNIINSKDFLMVVIQVPLELTLAIIFLYVVLGWSAFVGFASIVVLLPAPGFLAAQMQKIQAKKMEMTDARVEAVSETVGVLRMIKLFGWEQKMSKSLKVKRDEELAWIWKDKVIMLLNGVVNFIIPTITMVVTYGVYTIIMKEELNASKVFSSMAVFELVRSLLHRISWSTATLMKGKVSLDRVTDFLRNTELLDAFEETSSQEAAHVMQPDHPDIIGFNDAVFAWSKEAEDGTQTPSSRAFRLRVDGQVTFKRNAINLIIGPTGSGKTSILMALLGEMHFVPPSLDSWYNLPRGNGVAYAAQESWVQNETIRENILFGSPYEEERYQKVIYQCGLQRDLELFEAGDKTEVGEKGLTLSGGQKARVTLARAIYSTAEIILLDDVLAALDVHTSKWIVNECLLGDLVRGRTVLLVTHNIALTSAIADHIVSIGLDGIARDAGNDISAAIASDRALARELEHEQEEVDLEAKVVDTVTKEDEKSDGKLIVAEEIVEGRVGWKAMKLLLKGLGGDRPIFFLTFWLLGLAFMHGANSFAIWFLGYWGSQYETHAPQDVRVTYYLTIYSLILTGAVSVYILAASIYNLATQRASRTINAQLVDSILGSTLRWLDETPTSRVIARCTQDIATLDNDLAWNFGGVVELAVFMIVKLGGPVIFTPIFLLPGVLILFLGVQLGNIYLRAQMSVKREMSNARSPVLAHFGAAIAGLVSIRAYGAQKPFKGESLKRIDHFIKISRTSYNLNRWIGIRTDLLGATFTTALASYLLIRRSLSSANTGFSLNMSIEFCSVILYLVRSYNDFEVQANSLERIQGYLDIEHEPEPTEAGKPPAAWPKSGELQVERLSARYSATGPKVLHDLSFHIKSGERIGIVGRTGSGKSSLTLSLLRCIFTEGSVYFDGIPTNTINLDALRSSITIIPQMPELLSGTLRRNLDPFEQNDDAALNDALRSAGLFALQSELDEGRLTLDSEISSGGGNLSVGQRQIIALARAIVRSSKLLILDEATSAIDHKTDAVIQSTLRNELGSDVTVLTVAHRLQTIMDADKIMVLDSGRIVEFDAPNVLLQKKGGAFKSLVDGSGDKKALYAMTEKKAGGSQ